ncbi:hypothetical protein FJ651_11160 [Paucihalobacter ruber]|uniref:Uncharacterized protein n=1 Tax=Paucihalobacter ruber TaxID=2567861 RepID=A0A506PHY9_9FLAO|nr:hypothetical protein FJ651_11160 [Paucihalobacter ruber]
MTLKRKCYPNFVVCNNMILEIKSCEAFTDAHIAKGIIYLKVSISTKMNSFFSLLFFQKRLYEDNIFGFVRG